jgi:fumarate reductase subunit D
MKRLAEDYTRSHEPIAWSLFGAGGMVVAFITPVLILISALLVPLGLADSSLLSYANLLDLLNTGWGALAIFIVIALQLFHAAHRIYHGLHDVHIEGNTTLMLLIFYGGASALSLVTGVLLWALYSTSP